MLSIIRKSNHFQRNLNRKYELIKEKLPKEQADLVSSIQKTENEYSQMNIQFENELKALELKYDKEFNKIFNERKEKISKANKDFPCFWLNALSNNRLFKEFIHSRDEPILKHLSDISFKKLEDGTSFKLIFQFEKNDFFKNETIEKEYSVNEEHLITEIKSTKIEWLNEKSLFEKKKLKLKNKKTGEIKTVEENELKPSFFNFFCNVRLPNSKEEVSKLSIEEEKELGRFLDMEFEYGMEFCEEFIPHVLEYYLGFKTESEEYSKYLHKVKSGNK